MLKKLKLKSIGPGLLFASTTIGTSHLVLSTRAGAHHGMVYIWIILIALMLKYPFYEFGPRYANATGFSLIKSYRDQGKWAVVIFLFVIFMSMFSVIAAIGALCAGLLSSIFQWQMHLGILTGLVLAISAAFLLLGGFRALDRLIKMTSVLLLITVIAAFISVVIKGPVQPIEGFQSMPIFEGAGLTLLIGLIGWMPAGMEASTMNSIWNVEKCNSSKYQPSLKEALFDFRLGYGFSLFMASVFLTIGAYTSFGTGTILDGNANHFISKLLSLFTANLGKWSFYIIAIASFGTIYGTLIAVMDVYPRCFVRGLRALAFEKPEDNDLQKNFLEKYYSYVVVIASVGSFLLFYLSASSMLKMLQYVTALSFILAPFIGFINLKAVAHKTVPASHKPSKSLLIISYIGLAAMIIFAVYYISNQLL